MELRHLLALDAVLTTGSFTAAAAARHISQPALWAQIKELETELGLALFVRSGRGVAPTAACAALRPHLQVALDGVVELRRIAAEIRAGWDAPARIGCAPSHVSHFLAGCIEELVRQEPRTPFPVIVPVTTDSAVEALARGRVDLLVEPRAKPIGPDAAILYRMQIVAVGPLATQAARRGMLEVSALAAHPLATMPAGSLVRTMLEDAARRTHTSLRVIHESRDAPSLLALARANLCTAVVHNEIVEAETTDAVRVVVGGRPLEAPLWLAWRPDEALSPAARMLRDVMRRRARTRGIERGARSPVRR